MTEFRDVNGRGALAARESGPSQFILVIARSINNSSLVTQKPL